MAKKIDSTTAAIAADTVEKTVDTPVVRARSFRSLLAEDLHTEAGNNISWRSIFAGVVTFISLTLLFMLVGIAIGLGGTDLTAQDPTKGVGTGLLIWTIASLVISLAAAGFVAGLTANRAGFIHGFLTWATGLIVLVILATSAVSSAFGFVGNMLGGLTSAAGNVASSASSVAADAFNLTADDVKINTSNISSQVQNVLANSSVEQLHPDYLQKQIDATLQDVQTEGKNVLVNGESIQTATDKVSKNIQTRIDNIGKNIDEKALAADIQKNTDLSAAESASAAHNVVTAYKNAQQTADKELKDLSSQAQTAFDNAVKTTNDAMNNTAKYSLYAFAGLVIAAILTTLMGLVGSRFGSKANQNLI